MLMKRGSNEGPTKFQRKIKDFVADLEQEQGRSALMCQIEVLQDVLMDIQHLRGADKIDLEVLDQLLDNSKC